MKQLRNWTFNTLIKHKTDLFFHEYMMLTSCCAYKPSVNMIQVLAWGIWYMMWWCIYCMCWRQHSSLNQTLIVYLAGGASVTTKVSEEATGASVVLTSAAWCTATWDTSSSETAVVVSTSITVVTEVALSACTAGAAVVPGAITSAVLKSDRDRSNHTTWL